MNIGNLSFGVCHGHQIMPSGSRPNIESLRRCVLCITLSILAMLISRSDQCETSNREMGVDVLVTGHTQALDIWQGEEGGLYINPGSVRS